MQRELDIVRDRRVAIFRQRALYCQILAETPSLEGVVGNYLHEGSKRSAGRFFTVLSVMKHRLDQDALQSINRFVSHFAAMVAGWPFGATRKLTRKLSSCPKIRFSPH